MKIDAKYLYDLLPAYYRVLDEEQEKPPLRAFIEILAREAGIVEDNITQLYENWFIETCDEWVVPYIGELLGVKNIHEIEGAPFSRRAYIANTLAYRRRKGTAPVLEQLAFDVTGWRSKVVEFFQLLATTQNVNHVRLHNKATPDMRQMNALELVDTAFDKHAHTVEVGRISAGLGKYNIHNIGIYLWRLQENHMKRGTARAVPAGEGVPEGAYTFSPLGFEMQLFNFPRTEDEITHLAKEANVPGPLRRRGLYDELEKARAAAADGKTPQYQFLIPDVLQLFVNSNPTSEQEHFEAVSPKKIAICNLSEWRKPKPPLTAAIDPVLGRITFDNPEEITGVLVNYNYGFSGDVGGGPYDRSASLAHLENIDFDWHGGVSKDHLPVSDEIIYKNLQEAITQWHELGDAKKTGLITIMDNRTYEGDLNINIPEGKQLYIIAADWPEITTGGVPRRKPGSFNPEDVRPHIRGSIQVEGSATKNGGGLSINGLLIEGNLTVNSGKLNSLSLHHSTLVPGPNMGKVEANSENNNIQVSIGRSICGPVIINAKEALVTIEESIIDFNSKGEEAYAIEVPEGRLGVQKCTVFGKVNARLLDAGNSIFNGKLKITRRQSGCVRFSYVPLSSATPRRYRCQPEMETQKQIRKLEEQGEVSDAARANIGSQVSTWLLPVFNSTVYGHHAYGQLGSTTPEQIAAGAENASEMGVFNHLQQPQREANLRIVLEEYLRLGLEAGIIYAT